MSQENVDLYRRAAQAFNDGDLDALLAVMDPDVEAFRDSPRSRAATAASMGCAAGMKASAPPFPTSTPAVVEVRDLGHLTFAELRNRGRGAGSDTPFEQSSWHVAEWRDEKCVRWTVYGTRAEALSAAGLVDPPASRT